MPHYVPINILKDQNNGLSEHIKHSRVQTAGRCQGSITPNNVELRNIWFILAHFKVFLCNWLLNQHT